jgi:3-dehydrotetronate 4-kinase
MSLVGQRAGGHDPDVGAHLGVIADDFTGATDLANNLVRRGMRVVLTVGVPTAPLPDVGRVDGWVIALKSRSAPVGEAVGDALRALAWLRERGCRQLLFKYCSTFDSTPAGNIGPVADALLDALDAPLATVCPAFPEGGRTVYQGYLFADGLPLHETGMAEHPLTPMTDASLLRLLAPQTRRRIGLVPYRQVASGVAAVTEALAALQASGVGYAVVDALDDAHLETLAAAAAAHPLITGGSGVGLGIAERLRRQGLLQASGADRLDLPAPGRGVVLSGSCSRRTLSQVAWLRARAPVYAIDPLALAEGRDQVGEALRWVDDEQGQRPAGAPLLIVASAAPERVRAIQAVLGAGRASRLVEETFAAISRGLVERGVRRLVVAGGETSGAVVRALGIRALRIGPQIDPGVPWTATLGADPLALALKSGNFGADDFFLRAFEVLA